MNILQLSKYYPPVRGGLELVAKTFTMAHQKLGDKVTVICFDQKEAYENGQFGEKIQRIKQDYFFNSTPLNLSFIFHFNQLLETQKFDRIYVHLPNPYMHEVLKLNKQKIKDKGIKIIGIYHSDIVNQKKLAPLYNYYFLKDQNLYDLWIASSDKLWNSSPLLSKLDSQKQRIIPFCTEGEMKYQHRLKMGQNIVSVGRLVPYKGFEILIQALNKKPYQVHIIGDGPLRKKLQAMAASNIHFHTNLNDEKKRELFTKSDLLVVSSINRAEAYGMTIVEAFEAGLPVLASNIDSGVTSLVQHEKTGLVFNIGDSKALFESIERLSKEDGLYSKLSAQGRQFYQDELNLQAFTRKVSSI